MQSTKIMNRFEKSESITSKRLKIVGVIKLKQSSRKQKDPNALTPRTKLIREVEREKCRHLEGSKILKEITEE